jgi:D-alanine-D-alanine ligase
MKKINQHIQIVLSDEPRLSCIDPEYSARIIAALKTCYTKVGVWVVNEPADVVGLLLNKPDLVFLGIRNKQLENTSAPNIPKTLICEFLEANNINYTGSPMSVREIGASKDRAKAEVQKAGLPTAEFFTTLPGEYPNEASLPLGFPLFIKPPNRGQGKGIDENSVVRSFVEYEKKVRSIFVKFGSYSLVESYLTGREFSVGVFETGESRGLSALPVEIVTPPNRRGDCILGGEVKNADTEKVIAVPEGKVRDSLEQLATQSFLALGMRDYGRVDIRMDKAGRPYFVEANMVPGLGGGYLSRACRINLGMSYEDMILKIVSLALSRTASVEDLVVA